LNHYEEYFMNLRAFAFASITTLVTASASLIPTAHAEETSPSKQLSQTINEIIDVVEKMPGDENIPIRRELLEKVINPHFDFSEMAKRSMGSYWMKANPNQKKEFVQIFSKLLSDTYLSKIETVERGMVTVTGEDLQPSTSSGTKRAIVKSTVTSKGDVFPIDYKLYSKGKGWKVYDVIIENIGLVANYRSEFAGIIRKDGIDGLIVKLKEKSN
jgi:phospholipid transport system substrate-binding protein